jgi:hypothetical protein
MARFDMEQTMAVVAIQQLINEWGYDLDVNEGLGVPKLITEDCAYVVRAELREGRAAVEKFYRTRLEELKKTSAGPPLQRHVLSNLRVDFKGADEASIAFTLVYFTTAGMSSGAKHADPAAVADVRMDCRRVDGDWLISAFDSGQSFVRVPH